MRCGAAFVLWLGGCDYVWLDRHVDAPAEPMCPLPDEDGDCLANASDNCPGRFNVDQRDDDRDGIGDLCDPNPMLGGDRLVRFDAFDDSEEANQWFDYTDNGKWTYAPGEFRHFDSGDNTAPLQSTTTATAAVLALEVGFRFAAWSPAAANIRVGIILDHATKTTPGHSCWFTPAPDSRALMQEQIVGDGIATSRPTRTIVAGDRMYMLFARDAVAQRIDCRVQVATDAPETLPSITASAAWPTERYYTITSSNAGVTLDYVAIYDRP